MMKKRMKGYSGFDENPGEEYLGEEEMEESEHVSTQKTKQDQTPLWKYDVGSTILNRVSSNFFYVYS